MEINITPLIRTFGEPEHGQHRYFGSIVTHGKNAAKQTWEAALDAPFKFVTEENRQAVFEHFLGFGFSELNDDIDELNALLIQDATACWRETYDWDTPEELAYAKENFSTYVFGGDDSVDGEWYYCVSA